MAQRVETFDWTRTPLGPREIWPQGLETLVGTVLQAPLPMFIWWGPELIGLYNDACIPFLAERHPQALGCPASETWADLWPDLGHQAWDVWQECAAPDARRIFTPSNESPRGSSAPAFSLSPIPGTDGWTGGLLGIFHGNAEQDAPERWDREQALRARERQQSAVAELGRRALSSSNADEVLDLAVRSIADVLEVEYCKVLQLSSDRTNLLVLSGVGWRAGVVGQARIDALDRSQASFTLASSEPVIVEDLRTETRFSGPSLLIEHGVISGLSCLIAGPDGHPWGVLGAHTRKRRVFTQDDVNFLTAMANVLAALIERLHYTQVLREREADLHRAQAVGHIGSWRLELESGRLIWSAETHRILGVPEGTPLSFRTFLSRVHPDDRVGVKREWKAALRGGPYDIEHRLLIDGEMKWVRERAELDLDSDGRVRAVFGITQDITARKQAEAATRESEERLRVAAEGVEMGIWDLNLRTNIATRTLRHDQIFGYRELQPLWTLDIALRHVLPEDRPAIAEAYAIARETGKLFHESRVRWPDGSIHWISARGRMHLDAEGKPLRIAGVVFDITERKGAEEALRESEERQTFLLKLSDALRQVSDAVEVQQAAMRLVAERLGAIRAAYYEVDPDETGVAVAAGFERTDAVSLPRHMRHDDYGASIEAEYRAGRTLLVKDTEVEAKAESERAAYRAIGVRAWVGVPLVKNGRLEVILGVHSATPREWRRAEIELLEEVAERTWAAAERARAEAALRESEVRARRAHDLIKGISEATEGLVAALDTDLRFIAFNTAYQEVFQQVFGPCIELGMSIVEALAHLPDDQKRAVDLWRRALEGETVFETQEFGDPQRERRFFDLRFGPIRDASGRIIGAGEFASDVTERVQGERALREAKQRLEEADQRKDVFLATLAHELRNPLAPIRTGLDLVQVLRGDAAACEEPLQIVDRQFEHLVHLVDDLLDVSRISRGKIQLHREWLDVGEVIRAALEMSDSGLSRGDRRLTVSVPSEPLAVEGDRVRLVQVVANLLNNAAKFTEVGGRIDVQVTRQGERVEIQVQDDGRGIPRDRLDSMFEMFSQVEPGRASGLGIGLSLVRGLVEMHSGTVVADSAGRGCGATFTISLPLCRGALVHSSAETTTQRDVFPSQLRVLVVDDNRDIAEGLDLLLTMLGAEVRVAHDGAEAIEIFEEWPPTHVLMDLGMPGMDDFDAARRLRAKTADHAFRLIAMTGWGQEEDRQRTREAGFHEHLVKPVGVKELKAVLNR